MHSLPVFTDGIARIRNFANGGWGLEWVSADDHISMFQQLVCLILLRLMGSPWACVHVIHKEARSIVYLYSDHVLKIYTSLYFICIPTGALL